MPDIMSAVVSALRADQSRLEQASLNAANATTPGYKRTSLVALSFSEVMDGQQPASARSADQWVAPSYTLNKVTDFAAGSLQHSGRTLDVAVEGRGFIQLTNGSRTWLTRTASLQVNELGELVGSNGLKVVGLGGDLHPGTDNDLTIAADGELTRGGQSIGRIELALPKDEAQLTSDDGVLFVAASDKLDTTSADAGVIRSGFLEGSNTNNLKEMLSVMESVRHFESLIRLAQGYDDVMGKSIQKLGEV